MNQQNFNIVSDFLLEYGVANPSRTLIQAIAEGSNRSSDWHWYAEQVETDAERAYCFARALYIDPKDRAALDGLKALNDKQQAAAPQNASPNFFRPLIPALNALTHLLEG